MTYANMKKALDERGITQRQVAESMGMSENNFSLKLNERIPMTVDEAKFIHRKFLPTVKLDYLLESDGDVPTKREKDMASLDVLERFVDESGTRDLFGEVLDEMRGELAAD